MGRVSLGLYSALGALVRSSIACDGLRESIGNYLPDDVTLNTRQRPIQRFFTTAHSHVLCWLIPHRGLSFHISNRTYVCTAATCTTPDRKINLRSIISRLLRRGLATSPWRSGEP